MFDIDKFADKVESVEEKVVRWDRLTYDSIQEIVSKSELDIGKAREVLNHVQTLREVQMLNLRVTEGVTLHSLYMFISSIYQADEDHFHVACQLVDYDLSSKGNNYNETNTILWRRFLMDLFNLIDLCSILEFNQRDYDELAKQREKRVKSE